MASLPSVPAGFVRSLKTDGYGNVDRALLWSALQSRVDFLDEARPRACGWAEGPQGRECVIGAITSLGSDALPNDFGTLILPPVGNGNGAITAWLYVSERTAGYDPTYRAEVVRLTPGAALPAFGPGIDIGTPTAVGWISVDLQIPQDGETYGVRFTSTATVSSGGSQRVGTIAVLAKPSSTELDGTAVPTSTTFEELSLADLGDADRPDDVYAARRLRRQQGHVACRYPRVLGQHSFAVCKAARLGVGAIDDSQKVIVRYKVPRGPRVSSCTLGLYLVQTLDGLPVTGGRYAVDVDKGAGLVSAIAATNIAGTSLQWITATIPAANFDADETHEVVVSCWAAQAGDGIAINTMTVLAVDIFEDEYTTADIMVGAEAAPSRSVAGRWAAYEQGREIVGDHAAGDDEDNRADILTLATSTAFQALRRSAKLVEDYIFRILTGTSADSEYYRNASQIPLSSPFPLFFAKERIGYGCDSFEVWIVPGRVGTVDAYGDGAMEPTWELYVDGTATGLTFTRAATAFGDLGESAEVLNRSRRAFRLGTFAVTENTTYVLEVRCGWATATGDDATPTSDAAVLEGVMVRQLAREDAP